MKTVTLVLLLILGISTSSCNDDDNEVQTLPEATQTGRGIFACYVDGKPFIDTSGDTNGISFNCYYQLIDGEYYFGIGGDDNTNPTQNIYIYGEKRTLEQGMTYQLKERIAGSFSAGASFILSPTTGASAFTDLSFTGELNINKFDLQNQIVSGTFWFDVENPYTGERVEIREGRFDTHFGL